MSGLKGAVDALNENRYVIATDGCTLDFEKTATGDDGAQFYNIGFKDGNTMTVSTKDRVGFEPHTFLISEGGKAEFRTLYVLKTSWEKHKDRFEQQAKKDEQALAKITASKPNIASSIVAKKLEKPAAVGGKTVSLDIRESPADVAMMKGLINAEKSNPGPYSEIHVRGLFVAKFAQMHPEYDTDEFKKSGALERLAQRVYAQCGNMARF